MVEYQTADAHTCRRLRDRVLEHVYGQVLPADPHMHDRFIQDLYPLDAGFVDNLLSNIAHFDLEQIFQNAAYYPRLMQFYSSTVNEVYGYDFTDITCQGLLAYRFDAYDAVWSAVRALDIKYPQMINLNISNRLDKAITILTIPDELDAAYFQNQATAYTDPNALEPAVIFTEIIDWFINFVDIYGVLAHAHTDVV